MKKFTLSTAVALLAVFSLQAQWKQTYLWSSPEIRVSSVVNNNVVWLKDYYSTKLSYTLDGGATWVSKDLPKSFSDGSWEGGFCAVSATTAFNIASTGAERGIYKTTDNGTTWTKQTTGFNVNSPFPDLIYFWNENEGVAIGDGSATQNLEIYTTTNGGNQWNLVPNTSMPIGTNGATFSNNASFRVRGNTFYFMANTGQIFKSTNKGLTWSVINTPFTDINFMSFDFKDDNNGVLSYRALGNYQCYTTTDGGVSWTKNTAPKYPGSIKYSSFYNVYFSTNAIYGLTYSNDNGQTWINHPSFVNVGLGELCVTETGRLFVGGKGSVFTSDNYLTSNISVKSSGITDINSIDIAYTQEPYAINCKDTSNYNIGAIHYGKVSKIKIKSITQDAVDKSIVHLIMDDNLPQDSIRLYLKNIYDSNGTNGSQLLYNDPGYLIMLLNYNPTKTINNNVPGALLSQFTATERRTLRKVIITGAIDTRDFRILRDSLSSLTEIDLSGVYIAAYTGTEGTYGTTSTVYPAGELPQYAFYNNATSTGEGNLTSVVLPSSIISIGSYAFEGCSGLTTMNIPSTVTSINNSAFEGCTSLNSVNIPSSAITIGDAAFNACSALTAISIPSSVTSIGNAAFYGCTGINTINVPSSVTSIGISAFSSNIIVDANNPNYSSLDGVLFDKNKISILTCPTSKSGSYTIPSTVITIASNAFQNCSALTSVSIPSTLTSIGNYAFYFCPGLTSISIPSSVTTINNYAFGYCYGLTLINIPSSVTYIGSGAFYYCTGLTSVSIPSTTTYIGARAFFCNMTVDVNNPNYSSLDGVLFNKNKTSVLIYPRTKSGTYDIPLTVTSIGAYAFFGCSTLTSVRIPFTVTSYSNFAFSGCTGLTSITSFSTTPVNLSAVYNVFSNVNKTTCTLYVPMSSKSKYQAAAQWSDFTNIVELTTAVNEQRVNEPLVYGTNNILYIENAESDSSVRIYDTTGRIRYSGKIQNSSMNVELTKGSIYLVQINAKSYKVIL
jgi:photosystem II stability/assembly factor-like uncharacterized protein